MMKKIAFLTSLALFAILLSGCSTPGGEKLELGNPAPDFSLTDTDGSTYRLSENLGEKPVLLFFHMADG
jgi:cytochrome oxidase Cu insertion factor (SCO1/SenC/PrrC family)